MHRVRKGGRRVVPTGRSFQMHVTGIEGTCLNLRLSVRVSMRGQANQRSSTNIPCKSVTGCNASAVHSMNCKAVGAPMLVAMLLCSFAVGAPMLFAMLLDSFAVGAPMLFAMLLYSFAVGAPMLFAMLLHTLSMFFTALHVVLRPFLRQSDEAWAPWS